MRQFLFPTNFSKNSKESLMYASNLCANYDAQLVVFNSYYSTQSPRRTFLSEGTRRDETLKKLKTFTRKLDLKYVTPTLLKVEEGYAIRNIIKYSKKRSIELVILNRSQKYQWIDKIIGTRLSHITSSTYCPSLVLPTGYIFKKIDHILVYQARESNNQDFITKYLHNLFGNSVDKITQSKPWDTESKKTKNSIYNKLSLFRSASFYKQKKRIQKLINRILPDLFVLELDKKSFLQQLFENSILLPIILELNIPVLVINQNTIQANKESNSGRVLSNIFNTKPKPFMSKKLSGLA